MLLEKTDFQVHGILANYWCHPTLNPLEHFHRHNEVELNLLTQGRGNYVIAGRSVPLPVGSLCVFWAGFSHKIVDWQSGGEIWSLAIPLSIFLRWPLPQATFVYPLLHGEMFVETDSAMNGIDVEMFRRWHTDLRTPSTFSEPREIVLLELQARIRRLAGSSQRASTAAQPHSGEAERVAKMLQYIAVNYADDITVADIAKSADTNPSYAMELFKRSCGVTVMQYVNDQRVAHARRMLATSNAKVLDIALGAGFGSLSQFHNVFRKVTGQTPREYARSTALKVPVGAA